MIVLGAGMAGLLAAGILRDECICVIEAQESLPNNHSAVLRFRSSVVGDALNIRFKEVKAIKAVAPWMNPVADALSYSLKTNGTATLRSVLTANGEPQTRYIAPPDMIQQMAGRVSAEVLYGREVDADLLSQCRPSSTPVVSTLPMPVLMELMGWEGERPDFGHVEGTNYGIKLRNTSAYCSLYVPRKVDPMARISITGDELVAECYGPASDKHNVDEVIRRSMALMGVLGTTNLEEGLVGGEPWKRKQKYAKILPIDDGVRREFIMWASERGVYSLGRFATWRPGLLLDDLVNDVRVIQRLVSSRGEAYQHRLKGN